MAKRIKKKPTDIVVATNTVDDTEVVRQAVLSGHITEAEALEMLDQLPSRKTFTNACDFGLYYFPNIVSKKYCGLHYHLADVCEKPWTSTLAPRGHGKTTFMGFIVPLYLALNGDMVNPRRWLENQIELKNGVIMTASAVRRSLRGINYKTIRPDWMLLDDLYDEDDF